MTNREKILAAIVISLFVVLLGVYVVSSIAGVLDQRQTAITSLRREIRDKQQIARRGQQAAERLSEYEARSLPPDREIAQSLYQSWLLEEIQELGLAEPVVDGRPGRPVKDVYYVLSYQVRGKGSLTQITKLLHRFYSKNLLQKIRDMTVKPVKDSDQLSIDLNIEALVLNDAAKSDQLSDEPSHRLAYPDANDYVEFISARKIFSPSSPSSETNDKSVTDRDDAKLAKVSGITIGAQPIIWMTLTSENRTIKLAEGDEFKAGSLSGSIVQIGRRQVQLTLEGVRLVVPVGSLLSSGKELAAEDG